MDQNAIPHVVYSAGTVAVVFDRDDEREHENE